MRIRTCLILAMLASTLGAQQQIDLSRYFFATPEAERAARGDLEVVLAKIGGLRGNISSSPHALLMALQLRDNVRVILNRHRAYLHLRCDQIDNTSCADARTIQSMVASRTAFIDAEILGMPDARILGFLRQDSSLKHYGFAIESIRRNRPHVLVLGEQELLDRMTPEISGWQWDLYSRIATQMKAATAPVGSQSAEGRKLQFEQRFKSLADNRDLLAFTLINTVNAASQVAVIHKFPNAPAERYFHLFLEEKDVRHLLQEATSYGEMCKRLERVVVGDIQRKTGTLPEVWDRGIPVVDVPLTTLDAARKSFHEAFAGLGEQYVREFDDLLDPASGRASMSANGVGGAYSEGGVGSTTVFVAGLYSGTFPSLSRIAHEATHAVHHSLMSAHGVLPVYVEGPNYFSESFAEFAELLLADFLAEHAPTPALKRYYEIQFLDRKGLDFLFGAQDAALEQAIYDGVRAGTIKGPDDLDRVTGAVDAQFSIWQMRHPEIHARWADSRLFYQDPLYNVNYLYGGLLALKYYQLYQTDRAWFVPRYLALMENGFDNKPEALLKQFLNIDIRGDALLNDGMSVANSKLAELEATSK